MIRYFYTRNPVQLGEEMGYLPGDIGETSLIHLWRAYLII